MTSVLFIVARFGVKDFAPKADLAHEEGDCAIIGIGYDHAISEAARAAGE